MLVLTRKKGQSINIGDDVKVTVLEYSGGQIKLGIDAPQSVEIKRDRPSQKLKLRLEVEKRSMDIKPPFFYVLNEILLLPAPLGMGTCKRYLGSDDAIWESYEEFEDAHSMLEDDDVDLAWQQTVCADFYEMEATRNIFFTQAALEDHIKKHSHLYEGKLSWSLVHGIKNPEMEAVFDLLC